MNNNLYQQAHHIRHEAINVPHHASLFLDVNIKQIFVDMLNDVQHADAPLPEGYRLLSDELGDGYNPHAVICSGHRGRKELIVILADGVWRSQTERWGKALHLLNTVLYAAEDID